MLTRKAAAQSTEMKLRQALQELKESRDTCSQLLRERDDSEEEISKVIARNSQLKIEMAQMHSEHLEVIRQRDQLENTVSSFDEQCSTYERALNRITDLERELNDANRQILDFKEQQQLQEVDHTQSLFEELMMSSPAVQSAEQSRTTGSDFSPRPQILGQHLLSAILEKEHNLPTTSWWLGADECCVELNSYKVSNEVIQAAENRCNALIREAIPVTVKFCKVTDPDLDEAHTRGLPKDCMDTIRVICIGDIAENMSCGTHVSNLSQLQVIKLLGIEPGKGGKSILKFIVGNRVTDTLQLTLDREKALTGLLKNEPCNHEESVQKLLKDIENAKKSHSVTVAELIQIEEEIETNYDDIIKKLVLTYIQIIFMIVYSYRYELIPIITDGRLGKDRSNTLDASRL